MAVAALLVLGSCAEARLVAHAVKQIPDRKPVYLVGQPYEAQGVWYYPAEDYGYDATGIATTYPPDRHPSHTANGEAFDPGELTAAHKTLPLPSLVRVTNLDNGRTVIVRVNDRGTATPGRIIEVSARAAELLAVPALGAAKVRVTLLAQESRAAAAALQMVPSTATRQGVASDGSPAAMAAPRMAVERDGAPASPQASGRGAPALTDLVAGRTEPDGRFLPAAVVAQLPVDATRRDVYVQAGAFSVFENANRLRARLTSIGPARIDPVMVGDTQIFRVRLGPLSGVEQADSMLGSVVAAGVNGAQVVVD
ncbi:septal ring lytic transglycosylase RlpA family protein [Arenibaculum sp.]|jgi:rare lipoprotein A|uniref:septal ring lytic transglycosylase RlpA family protein n=1 Tax=Arenibaculum sp. TaxID=2865862 RepID=UPI002E0D225F|nr:septal ring lytic transglycosylase RlpA family protein [Arenibaculum sp.]